MPSTTDVFHQASELLKRRLAEIDEERRRLERALAELGSKATGRPRRGPGRPRRKRGRPPGRRKTSRTDQALKLVEKTPGATASEVAKAMKIGPNYVYRVLGDLEREGRIKKKGRQYFPATKA
jgi:sugar-specific transcriptional regulator TrmB